MSFPGGASGEEPAWQCRRQEMQVHSLSGEDPLEEAWPPTPLFLPGEPHGQRSLEGTVHRVAKSQLTQLK